MSGLLLAAIAVLIAFVLGCLAGVFCTCGYLAADDRWPQ